MQSSNWHLLACSQVPYVRLQVKINNIMQGSWQEFGKKVFMQTWMLAKTQELNLRSILLSHVHLYFITCIERKYIVNMVFNKDCLVGLTIDEKYEIQEYRDMMKAFSDAATVGDLDQVTITYFP